MHHHPIDDDNYDHFGTISILSHAINNNTDLVKCANRQRYSDTIATSSNEQNKREQQLTIRSSSSLTNAVSSSLSTINSNMIARYSLNSDNTLEFG